MQTVSPGWLGARVRQQYAQIAKEKGRDCRYQDERANGGPANGSRAKRSEFDIEGGSLDMRNLRPAPSTVFPLVAP
jgi:hypothetical protein